MALLLLLVCLQLAALILSQKYNVTVIDVYTHPVVSYIDGNSQFGETFNPSFIISSPTVNTPGLAMRTQNCSLTVNGSCVFCSGEYQNASSITFVECNNITTGLCSNSQTNPVNNNSIIFEPSTQFDIKGTEDPRILYNEIDAYYYMFYTSFGFGNQSNPKRQTVYLSLARSKYPQLDSKWTKYGAIFEPNGIDGSKSGALLVEFNKSMIDYGINYLYWGDDSIKLTVSDNITYWVYNETTSKVLIKTRSNAFDNGLVESGPPPLQLSDNNYIFFYNSATKGWPSTGAYHPGFVIIDQYNKSNLLQRSGVNEPLLTPEFAWDKGVYPYTCNVPNVVFLEAAVMFNQQQKIKYIEMQKRVNNMNITADNTDLIRVYFGGADTVIGTAVVQISYG